MVANPTDGPAFDAAREWRALESGLDSLTRAGQVQLVRIEDASEAALKRQLAANPFHVFHFIGRGQTHGARYATLVLEGQGNRARAVTARHLGELLGAQPALGVVVLQSFCGGGDLFREAGALLVADGFPSVVTAAPASDAAAAQFVRGIYSALIAGEPLKPAMSRSSGAPVVHGQSETVVFPVASAPASDTPPASIPASDVAQREVAEARARREELERRRAAGVFDVFLCHNAKDKPAVKDVGRQLMDRGILPWLDVWQLRPGMPWQRLLEEQIADINAAAVFVGADGMGPWQRQELDSFLRQFVTRSCPVIPVLLPDAPREPQLPIFLQGMTWVDFRSGALDALDRLIWGITGRPTPMGL